MRVHDEANAIVRRAISGKRPVQPPEPAFQAVAASVHLFCALFNLGAAIYHFRRVRTGVEDA